MDKRDQLQDQTEVDFHRGEDKMKHYSLPEGYMRDMQSELISRLEEERLRAIPSPQVSWWTKLKPSLYLAASFVGLWIGFKGLMHYQQALRQVSVEQVADIDDSYLSYYEDYAESILTQEAEWAWEEVEVANDDILVQM